MAIYLIILFLGLASGCLSGIIGTGSSIVLLPVLVFESGPQQAVPIMAIAAFMANIGKVWAWRRETDWSAFIAFSLTAVPAAALGAHTLFVLPPDAVETVLGVFFIAMIPARRWLRASNHRIGRLALSLCGAVIGFLTGIVLSTGPIMIPAFAAHGLIKGALLATEALSSLAITLTKIATFGALGALPFAIVAKGAVVGASVMAGTFIGKAFVQRMSDRAFHFLLDAMLLVSGLSMLFAALR